VHIHLNQITHGSPGAAAATILLLILSAHACAAQQRQPIVDTVFSWHQEGGIAGFCDDLTVSSAGELRTSSCGSTPKTRTGKLSQEDKARLDRWRRSFGSVVIDTKDSPAADAMTVKLTLKGSGSARPSGAERQDLLDWAQQVYTRNRP
jgi:hypothetical protein